jgi:hypothetical protein
MMPEQTVAQRQAIQDALRNFDACPLKTAATNLLAALGYASEKTANLGNTAEALFANIEQFRPELGGIDREKVSAAQWRSCAFLFQLSNDEIPALAAGQHELLMSADRRILEGQIESFVFLAIELAGENWSRARLAAITRELNKRFPMPAILLFKQESLFSLAVIDRRQNRRDASRDVIDSRITLIKDVRLAHPHRAHVEILASLALQNLGDRRRPGNFRELYEAWIEALSTQALNKRFYTELAWWYFWAVKQVDFPLGGGADATRRNSVAVIRLLTRLIFIWFIKEKGLVPDDLFERDALKTLLKEDPAIHGDESNYYLAILQNLFFATLNVEMGGNRKWAQGGGGMKGDRLIHSLFRHDNLFREPKAAFELFARIPFLNGGLFECLDREVGERDFQRNPELRELAHKEGNGWVLRVDGFSRRKEAQPRVPNKLFLGGEENIDLNVELGASRKPRNVLGLLDLFSRYKFTVDENTPLEEEVALDPELLGKVFENLLASYNEDTSATARKQSGSFYTPREVVDYMVDEALIAYFARHLPTSANSAGKKASLPKGRPVNAILDLGVGSDELDLSAAAALETHREEENPAQAARACAESRLRRLLAYGEDGVSFSADEKARLIVAIERLKILDPACGSGAYPMGILNKLVHVLQKLDPGNQLWRAQNRTLLETQLAAAGEIPDPALRETKVEEAEAALIKFDLDFSDSGHADYTRKLYLIEKCIHGVDIQPIAVQIAKLRFFIALIVSQPIDPAKPNLGITPLPNLETKIVAADSLAPIERPRQMGLRDPDIDRKEKELIVANNHYFAARTAKTKRKWRERIFELRDALADLLEKDLFLSPGVARQLVHWNPFDQNAAADFFDPEWMFQLVGGFDITIGNPPYVRQEGIKHLKDKLKARYDCFTGTADLYIYFYERGIKLLKPGGAFAFITSNKWYRAKYGDKLRDWMNRHTRLKHVIDFGDEAVFSAIAYPTIVIATRRETEVKHAAASDMARVLNWRQGPAVETFPAVFAAESFTIPQAGLRKEGWQLEPSGKRQLLARIQKAGVPLGEYVNGRFYRGILTGLNEAFVIDAATRERLIAEDPKSAEVIKPFLRGRDVKRWRVAFADNYLIRIESSENVSHPWSGKSETEAEKEFSRCYPAIYDHFQSYRQAMIDRYDQGKYFWELRACAYWDEFEQPKLIVPAIAAMPSFSPDYCGYHSNNKNTIFVSQKLHFSLGILNSSVNAWLATQICSSKQNGFYDFEPRYSSHLMIPIATEQQSTLIEIVVKIILATEIPSFERLLNGLAYELFFPEDLHAANIRLFDACEQAGIGKIAELKDKALTEAVNQLASRIFANDHPIYAMLFDMQALEVARVIEGKE